MDFINEKLMPIAAMVGNQKHLKAVRDGIALAMPFMIIGSFFLIIANFPLPVYQEMMKDYFGASWSSYLDFPVQATYGMLAILTAFGIAYRLAAQYKELEPIVAGAVAFCAFMVTIPFSIEAIGEGVNGSVSVIGISPDYLGSQGMFVAIVVAIISTEIYRFFVKNKITIKMPETVPPAVLKSFTAIIPAFVVIILFSVIRLLVQATEFHTVQNMITIVLSRPLTVFGNSYFGIIVTELIEHLFWSVGLHGSNIVASVMQPIWLALTDQNRVAFEAGQALPNIVASGFVEGFIWFGGSGCILSLAVLLTFVARSEQLRSLGRLSISASFFNISEPIMFGLPVVLNPVMMIPFIITPLVVVTITYFTMYTGLVAKPAGIIVPWTTPIFVSGFLVTGGKMSAVVLQLVNFIVATAIYYPFFRIWDNKCLKDEQSE